MRNARRCPILTLAPALFRPVAAFLGLIVGGGTAPGAAINMLLDSWHAPEGIVEPSRHTLLARRPQLFLAMCPLVVR